MLLYNAQMVIHVYVPRWYIWIHLLLSHGKNVHFHGFPFKRGRAALALECTDVIQWGTRGGTVFKVCKKIQYELPRTVLDFIDRQQLMSIVGMIKWFLKNPGGVSSGKRTGYWRTHVHFNKCDHGPDNDLFLFKCKLCWSWYCVIKIRVKAFSIIFFIHLHFFFRAWNLLWFECTTIEGELSCLPSNWFHCLLYSSLAKILSTTSSSWIMCKSWSTAYYLLWISPFSVVMHQKEHNNWNKL